MLGGSAALAGLMARPSATISVWLSVTRAWLLLLVFHSARKDGVVKKPIRGVESTSSLPARNESRAKIGVVLSPARGRRTFTISHDCVSATVSGTLAAGNEGGWQRCVAPVLVVTLNACGTPCSMVYSASDTEGWTAALL